MRYSVFNSVKLNTAEEAHDTPSSNLDRCTEQNISRCFVLSNVKAKLTLKQNSCLFVSPNANVYLGFTHSKSLQSITIMSLVQRSMWLITMNCVGRWDWDLTGLCFALCGGVHIMEGQDTISMFPFMSTSERSCWLDYALLNEKCYLSYSSCQKCFIVIQQSVKMSIVKSFFYFPSVHEHNPGSNYQNNEWRNKLIIYKHEFAGIQSIHVFREVWKVNVDIFFFNFL